MSSDLLSPLFTTGRMAEAFSDRARLQGMLDFEAALARAGARAGLFPAAAAAAIAARCRAELFDAAELGRAAARSGNPAIPLVAALTALVAGDDQGASRWVHLGAASQDAMDTGLVLQLRAALDAFEDGLERLSRALAHLAGEHRWTVLSGRTWLQPAEPVTLGLKAAGWLDAVERHRRRLGEVRGRALALQLGGAAGTLAALGPGALEVARLAAEELELALPDLPWHAHRDRPAEVATALGLLAGTLGKIAADVALLAQAEVGEAREPAAPGRGGSSSMPQKRNPVGSAVAGAAAVRVPGLVATMLSAMVQEHERGPAGWLAEWETLPEICLLVGGALDHVAAVAEGLEVDAPRMERNLAATQGLVHAGAAAAALARHLGRAEAHALVEQASRAAAQEGRHLRAVLAEDRRVQACLAPADLDRVFDARAAAGVAGALVDRALAARAGSRKR
jgi:3-carboxy-cis,cis-muconate cycloisomerase